MRIDRIDIEIGPFFMYLIGNIGHQRKDTWTINYIFAYETNIHIRLHRAQSAKSKRISMLCGKRINALNKKGFIVCQPIKDFYFVH